MTNEADALWEISVPLKKFLTFTNCPERWRPFNLYLVRDEQVVFYVGQSYCAFARVWEHIQGGPRGHSTLGRFILLNWPQSGGFHVELLRSAAPRFAPTGHDRDAAERLLIERCAPCFNVSLNREPTALPAGYLPPSTPFKQLRSYKRLLHRMLRQAGYAEQLAFRDSRDTEWE